MKRAVTIIIIAIFAVFTFSAFVNADQDPDVSDQLTKSMDEKLQKGELEGTVSKSVRKLLKKNRTQTTAHTFNLDGNNLM